MSLQHSSKILVLNQLINLQLKTSYFLHFQPNLQTISLIHHKKTLVKSNLVYKYFKLN